MACEYFVGGKWVTEAQFKEILNNGLLDNLVANGDISLKNYKTDNSKVIKRETKTITRDKIPANKLANILAKEIKSRAGYPMNMLAALELNSDGTDFKIPLWASPYATKFESLLTSLVSNKVVKQKLPGTSSVLGSEEGFKIKEGDEAAGDLKNSGIVFTESFDPTKGLQPMRWDPKTKKILPDQVIMPFKFRAESGEILNIDEFTVVVRDGEESRKMLDMTKVPKEILETFGFRIPTQKQNSMAAIEIVGFLPEGMGDLLLAPRDFTRRMGSDFDVDKLYQYFYNIFYQDGKLYNNFLSDPKAIEKAREATVAQIEELKDSLKFTKEERKLMDQYVRQNLERTEENEETEEITQKASDLIKRSMSEADRKMLNDAFTRLSVLNRSYVASRQNNIVKTHLRIANSSNPEVIKMFLGTDSPGMFKDLSQQVDNIRIERGLVPPVITILSDTYQRTKYINATAGKDAVGGFSLDSTFNAVAQGKDLIILNINPENTVDVYGTLQNPKIPTKENILTYNMPLATFGNTESKGDLSNKYTLRSQAIINKAKQEKRDLTEEEKKNLKYKSDIIRTLQSSALDNEKEQILDKLNINNQTFDAIRALALLGFEETDIAGLLSQEIIWEYVDALKDADSSLTPYNPNAEEDIVDTLISKYDPENKFRELDADIKAKYQSQSGEELMDNIATQNLKPLESGETPDYNLQQLAILEKFRTLSAHGKTIKQLQSTINTASKGLPKSLIEVNAKVEQISKLPFVEVFNGDKLLGEYVNNQLIKPEGVNGYASYYGTLFADKIFNEYFPYKTQGFQTAVSEILTHTPKGPDVSINKKAEVQAEVFEDVRSYLYGNPNTNLFTGDPTLERKRLFIDFPGNQSLATILNSVSNQSWFQKNGFLNKLSFDLNKNGQISRINFEAAAGENFDERNIYDGFVYLLTKNFPVGNFNGRDYTSRTLAQELIAAAFLEGGTQGAKQYLKYVPISYLKVLGFGDYLQKVPFDFVSTFYGNLSEYGPIYNQPSSFTRQYFQNNPDKTKTVSLSDLKGTNTSTPKDYFTLTPEALLNNFVDVVDPATGDSTQMQTQFLSIYDTKEPSKYALFEFDSVDRNYKRIPVLAGSYGFVAYNSTPNVSIPVERGSINSTPKLNAVAPGYNLSNIPVQPTKGFDINVVNNTAEPELTAGMPISKTLSGTKEALDDLLNNLETAEGVSTLNKQLMMLFRDLQLPAEFKVKYVTNGKGSYDYDSNTLSLNLNHKDHTTADGLATTVLHELTHTFTGEAIKKYERGDTDLSPSQIAAIQSLEKLQKIYIDNLTEQGEAGSLAEFKAKYEAYAASDKSKSSGLTTTEISKYYGAIKLSEFVTMALTDVEFQKRLNDIKTESGKTVWEQIKEALFNLLNTLGLDIKPGSALATSVKDTFDLIEANQEALKADNITTESFIEHGTKYKFQVNGNGEVIKAEYAQGMSMVYNPMNAKNAQKKYDSLKAGVETWKLFGDKPGQPVQSTVKPVEEIKEGVTELFESNPELANAVYEALGFVTPLKALESNFKNVQERLDDLKDTFAENLVVSGLPFDYFKEVELNIDDLDLSIKNKEMFDVLYQTDKKSDYLKSELTSIDKQKNPILINNKGQVVEGWHRIHSLKANGIKTVKAYVPITSLQKQQAQQLYSQYLDTIFPNSKVKDIVYHATKNKNKILEEGFDKNYLTSRTGISNKFWDPTGELEKRNKLGFFFAKNGQSIVLSLQGFGERFSGSELKNSVLPTILNLTNPQVIDDLDTSKVKEGYDGIISTEEFHIPDNAGGIDYTDTIYVAPEPEQIHILGNKEDIKGFKQFIDLKQTAPIFKEGAVDAKYELFPGVYANKGQQEAIDLLTNFLDSDKTAFLLQGKGGTGKTTIIKKIVEEAKAKGRTVLGIAPTHKAKKVLASSVKGIKTTTLAAALAIKLDETTGNFSPDEYARSRGRVPIKNADFIVIDESSMVSDKL